MNLTEYQGEEEWIRKISHLALCRLSVINIDVCCLILFICPCTVCKLRNIDFPKISLGAVFVLIMLGKELQ